MASRTTTKVSHYHVQKKRRAEFIEEWRELPEDCGRTRRRGDGADRARHPGRCLRGRRRRPADPFDGRPGPRDRSGRGVHHPPAFVGCDGARRRRPGLDRDRRRADRVGPRRLAAPAGLGLAPVRQRRQRDGALPDLLQRAAAGDDGHVGHRGRRPHPVQRAAAAVRRIHRSSTGDDPYARRVRRLARDQRARRSGRLHTSWDELELLPTPRGTRTTFLLDRAIGYQASGISMAMFEIGPGRGQSMHRHAGEAWLYVAGGHRPQLPGHRTRGRRRTTRGRRATSSSSTTSCGTSTSTTTRRRPQRSCGSTCSTACSTPCGC